MWAVVKGQRDAGLGYRPGNVEGRRSTSRDRGEQMAEHEVSDFPAPDLDGWLENPSIRITHSRRSAVDPEALWTAARLVRVRDAGLLGRLVQWRIPGTPGELSFDELFRKAPFCVLEERHGALVSGVVGRIWTLRRDYPQLADSEQFRTFDAPGTARVLFAMWAESAGAAAGGRLNAEVRVLPLDAQGRVGIAAVRPLIAAFHHLIGADGLAAAVRRAEAEQVGSRSSGD